MTDAPTAAVPPRRQGWRRISRNDVLLPGLIVVLVVFFAARSDAFLTADNLTNVSRQSVYLLLVALGQMVILVCGQLDLSVGATVALSSVVTAKPDEH